MKKVLRTIETALQELYNLDSSYRAESFLVKDPKKEKETFRTDLDGALLVQNEHDTVNLGIYLASPVSHMLRSIQNWNMQDWTHDQLKAFSVAVEELSHFHYFLYHAERGRGVSQFEMELQAEIDRFLVSYFAGLRFVENDPTSLFQRLYEQFFEQFRLRAGLTSRERERYIDASNYAKRLLGKYVFALSTLKLNLVLDVFRHFYRLDTSEKISFIERS